MLRFTSITIALSLLGFLVATTADAQWDRRYRIEQNNPPATELIVARWHFGTNGNIGHMGWSPNYPSSDENFNGFIDQSTRIDVEVPSYKIVELGSEEVFDYPFAYVSEPGEMELTAQEVENLREFINRGGFVLMDDFDGSWQLETMRSQVQRAFPDRPLIRLESGHRLFQINFVIWSMTH